MILSKNNLKKISSTGAAEVINDRDDESSTPLMVAIRKGKGGVAMTLFECGADVKALDNSQTYFETEEDCPCGGHKVNVRLTLLNIAVRYQNSNVINTVLDGCLNVNVNQRSQQYIENPFYFSIHCGDEGIMKSLLEAGFQYKE